MRYYPKLKKYKDSNVVYDETTEIATSYDWYILAKRINGTMIVNTYNYSNSTLKHMYKICNLFNGFGIEYKTIEAPKGLQDLVTAKKHYNVMIADLMETIKNPRTHKTKNIERAELIKQYQSKIDFINQLGG